MIEELLKQARDKYPAVIDSLNEFNLLKKDNEILWCLEHYSLVPRSQIVNKFRYSGEPFVNCTEIKHYDFLEEFDSLFRQYNFFVYSADKDSNKITLVTDYYTSVYENIGLMLKGYDVDIKYITPYNYDLLLHGYDYVLSQKTSYPTMFKRILYDAIEHGASDIHIVNNMNREGGFDYRIFYRELNDYVDDCNIVKLNESTSNSMIMDIISHYTIAEVADLELSCGVETSWLNVFNDGDLDLRLTGSKTRGGYTLVTRLQKMSTVGKKIANLGFNLETQLALRDLAARTTGLTLITGAVRTGKNTTMVAMINEYLDLPVKRMEFSSPIETIMPFEQLNYNNDINTLLDYVKLLKKQDVNLVYLNELPDERLAHPIIDIVNSSIGVITTFHINRLWNVCLKLQTYFGDDFRNLITQINGVVNQKMFVKLCPHCRARVYHRELPRFILELLDKYDIKSFYKPIGCPSCKGTGRENSVQPYAEYLIFTEELKSKLVRCKELYEMEDVLKEECYKNESNLEVTLVNAIRNGVIPPEDLMILR